MDNYSTRYTSSWPTVIIDDTYIPEYAAEIVELVTAGTVERDYAAIYALAVCAELKLRGVRLN